MKFDPKELGSLKLPKYPQTQVTTTLVDLTSSFAFERMRFLRTQVGKSIEKKLRDKGYDRRQVVATSTSGGGS